MVRPDFESTQVCGYENGDTADTPLEIAGLRVTNKYHTLGVWFSQKEEPSFDYEWNFQPILRKMKACFASWELRSLSLKGKIVVVNSLVLSPLQYMTSLIHTPRKVIDEVKSLTVEFIWGGGRSEVAYSTLIQPTACGGLNLADPETRIKVNYLCWTRRILREPQSAPAIFLQYLLKILNVSEFLRTKPKSSLIDDSTSVFYAAFLRNWIAFHSFPQAGESEIRNEVLWHNGFIGNALQDPILRKRWKEAGIVTVNDVCHAEENRLLSHI